MNSNQISAFEYVSILVSLILGLGITQILSSLADLLYNHQKLRLYWPHITWILFILFLHIQDWFITYQLKQKATWHLPEVTFVLLYPILLFMAAKVLLPTNDKEEKIEMKVFYFSQYKTLFLIMALAVIASLFFNIFLLQQGVKTQLHLLAFFLLLAAMVVNTKEYEWLHKLLALIILIVTIFSVVVEQNVWVIN